jgi:hypothetical protein
LSDLERSTLAEIGKRLGRQHLAQGVACIARPNTILAWYRRLIARKFDGSKHRSYPGRPRVDSTVEALIIRMAQKNSGWGYDRIAGALANLGHKVSDQTIGNILKWHGIAPAPQRSQNTTWQDFISAHMAVLAGTDFFTVEVLTWRGLVTYYVLFFLHLETRRVTLAGITRHPTETWMTQMARNAVDQTSGTLSRCRYVLHDRDAKYGKALVPETSTPQPKSECVLGALGAVRQGRMSLQARPVWRTLAPARLDRVRGPLSFGAQSSGQGQLVTLPFSGEVNASPKHPLPRTPRRPASILLPGRLNILTIRLRRPLQHTMSLLLSEFCARGWRKCACVLARSD